VNSPLNQFILLGFLAQGLTWLTWGHAVVSVTMWVATLGWLRGRVVISQNTEGILFLIGSVAAYLAGKTLNNSTHFFLGDALMVLQCARMARKCSARERLVSLLIACFHFAVLCTIAPNIRFLALFGGAIYLLPRALKEIALSKFEASAHPGGPRQPAPAETALGWRMALGVAALSVLGFLLLPRIFAGPPIQFRGPGGDPTTLFDNLLDPSKGGSANSSAVLLQMEGESPGYMRCLALTEFDGVLWRADPRPPLRRLWNPGPDSLQGQLKRRVRVKNAAYLGKVLPVDGIPSAVDGNFFYRPLMNPHTIVECQSIWSTANNVYEYWIPTNRTLEPILPRQAQTLIASPPQSQRLNNWINSVAPPRDATPYERARRLEGHLRDNFTYKLGAPELNRLNPIEDFVIDQKEGHCERFAAAMALFLRMQGTPSRVMIGYVPSGRNLLTGWHQIRFKDAHAWAEGWFEDRGWVIFDATPGGTDDSSEFGLSSVAEAVDFFWYSQVVNFDGLAQKQMLLGAWEWTQTSVNAIAESPWTSALGVALVLIPVGWLLRVGAKRWRGGGRKAREIARVEGVYGGMLQAFRAKGWPKPAHLTPYEFLGRLEQGNAPGIGCAQSITRNFCDIKYGGRPLNSRVSGEMEKALQELRSALKTAPRATP